jgi:hypothetical protein
MKTNGKPLLTSKVLRTPWAHRPSYLNLRGIPLLRQSPYPDTNQYLSQVIWTEATLVYKEMREEIVKISEPRAGRILRKNESYQWHLGNVGLTQKTRLRLQATPHTSKLSHLPQVAMLRIPHPI